MRAVKLMSILKELNIPVTNTEFPPNMKVNPPFIVFLRNNIPTFDADNVVYEYDFQYSIELYTCHKDEAMEEELLHKLDEHEINWSYVSDSRVQEGLYIMVVSI